MAAAHVTELALTAVKGMRVQPVDAVTLGPAGARGDRAFYVVDDAGRMLNGKDIPTLQSVVADYDPDAAVLGLTFPDGSAVRDTVAHGETITTRFFSRPREAQVLDGPWAGALSDFFDRPLRLVDSGTGAVDRGRKAGASLISRASLEKLAEVADRDTVNGRRFRMLIEVDGIGAHAEDGWVGGRVRVGEALLAVRGHVGRCVITNRDPATGQTDLQTLKLLGSYRRDLDTTEPVAFGVHAEVLEAGTVRVGDPVALDR
ncbi:MAG: MOSC N-terminal beta barrel domain-containing protein [Solirubrobacteraceae bacterium]